MANKKITVVGTRYPSDMVFKAAVIAVDRIARLGYDISTGDAIGIDKVAVVGYRAGRAHPFQKLHIYSAKGEDYPYKKNYVKYLHAMKNIHVAKAIAEFIHPAWNKMKEPYHQDLHTRNCYQVMGDALLEPTMATFTFAPSGDKVTGGTRTAYTLSTLLGIPTFNLYAKGDVPDIEELKRLFNPDKTLNEGYILSKRKPVNSELAIVIKEAIGDDMVLLDQFKSVYKFE